ncbi:ExbD/TolR family protein [Hymenobacter chitinivorans]|uniref:Biopolymer transport protein ExbD n=1 Tax=Hymenobacter chitinivorans DSM 11115 TaxID=1121954 RepID=A0A2M9B571_9BACT|nr:biopolymer transporter ExbD [Hymenobacter chitinivorans]PJJ53098.1 biopolymer transport protein ExbD [Hymenobacter chitinivorans DSM 11115]
MATPQSAPGLRSARRHFRRILHPDMTPMVGLGFLLVTFFLLAADFVKPTVMQLTMPANYLRNPNESICFGIDNSLSLILGKNGQAHYYRGGLFSDELPELHTIHGGAAGLRRLLLEVRQQDSRSVVLIKPSSNAKYRDLVDALDEMNITDQKRCAVVDLSERDYALLKQHGL